MTTTKVRSDVRPCTICGIVQGPEGFYHRPGSQCKACRRAWFRLYHAGNGIVTHDDIRRHRGQTEAFYDGYRPIASLPGQVEARRGMEGEK